MGQRGRWRYIYWRNALIVKNIGFAPASFLFSEFSKIGFGFKLAFIGFRAPMGGYSMSLLMTHLQ